MNLLEEIKNVIAQAPPEQAEQKVVDFLNRTDFSDPAVKQQSDIYIKDILENYIAPNKPITSLQAKTMHCILCKQALVEQGVPNVKITYRKEGGPPCFKDPTNTIDFGDNPKYSSVCCDAYLLKPYSKDLQRSEESRLEYFALLLSALEHEVRHAFQFSQMIPKTLDDITSQGYLMAKQHVARLCAGYSGTKYNKNDQDNEKLYHENHEEFIYEVDAYKTGYKRAIEKLKNLSPKAYDIAKRGLLQSEFNKWDSKAASYDNNVVWQHDTNPTNKGVNANHKASLIIDHVLPKLSSSDRKKYFERYPILNLTYKPDGSKKSLEEVERQREANINRILVTATPEEVKNKVPEIIKVYETAIESDPVLSFERCMKQIAMLSWDGTRHYTKGGRSPEEIYDPDKVMAELRAATNKARQMATYIEESDYRIVKKVFAKCKKELEISKKTDVRSQAFYEDKKQALNSVEKEISQNRDFKKVEEKDKEEAAKEQMRQAKAEEIIKKIFPNFTPQKIVVNNLTANMTSSRDNVEEKLLLEESRKRYMTDLQKHLKTTKEQSFVSGNELTNAINTFYNFQVTEEQKREFERKLAAGEIELLRNIYSEDGYLEREQELLPHKTRTIEPVKPEEIRKVREEERAAANVPAREEGQLDEEEEEYDEYGVRIVKKKQVVKKNNEQAVRQAQEQEEENEKKQGEERSL